MAIWELCSPVGNGISRVWCIRNRRLCNWGGAVLIFFLFTYFQLNLLRSTYIRQYEIPNDNIIDLKSDKPLLSKGISTNSSFDVSYIQRKIFQYNQEQIIHNQNTFEALQPDSIVIVIQVHDRISYLRHLIGSLAQARNISQALVVFSHDNYDEEINDLIESIDFCKVMQIFYPYSIQSHPNEFPGNDPGDCPRNIGKEEALIQNCNNALDSDMYGHYREAKFTQTKHHWWWKANRVFNQLDVTKGHEGLVVFLEEDHYVVEDFIHALKLMEASSKETCPSCNILSLGTYSKPYYYKTDSGKVQTSSWISSKHNMGMVLNKLTWLNILECAESFCTYDDYNWDWSLQFTSQHCLKQKLYVMVLSAPRVFHTGEWYTFLLFLRKLVSLKKPLHCISVVRINTVKFIEFVAPRWARHLSGLHHTKNNCEPTAVISKIKNDLRLAQKYLYPNKLIMTGEIKNNVLIKANGGWGDKRDHKLCIMVTKQ